MTPTPTPFIVRLTKNLHWAERALLIALVLGTMLRYLEIDTDLLTVSLIGLGLVFFLYAYKPVDMIRDEKEKFGFSDLLAVTILPKVMWISSAISTLGLLFYVQNLAYEKYNMMVMIGGLTIGIAVVTLTIFLAGGVKNLKAVTPILFRAVPLFLIDLYILFK